MSHEYQIKSASFNATSGEINPLVWCDGLIDNENIGVWFAVYFDSIQQANAVEGVPGVRKILAPLMLGARDGAPYPSPAIYSAPVAGAPFIAAPDGLNVDCEEALAAGQWTA